MNELIRINTEREHIYSPDIHVGIAARIDKVFIAGEIQAALEAVADRHPLLTATIMFDENNAAYYKLYSSKPILPEFIETDDDFYWREWMTETNRKAFDFANGPLLRMLVIHSESSATIALIGHHLLGDGLSFVYLMRDFLAALDGRLDRKQLMPPIIQNAAALPKAGQIGFTARMFAKKLNRDYGKNGRRFTNSEYLAMYENYRAEKQPAIGTFALNTEETQAVIANCRRHKVTVNEAIATAFFAARKAAGIQSDYLGVSCDIRKEMSENVQGSMGNFVSGICISACYDKSIDFWKNARRTGDLLNTKLKNTAKRIAALSFVDALDDTLVDAINFVGFGGYDNKTAKTLCDILCGVPADEGLGISNLGRQTASYEHFVLEEMFFVPPLFGSNDFVVGVFTVNDSMHFCLRYAAKQLYADRVSAIFEQAKALLLGA